MAKAKVLDGKVFTSPTLSDGSVFSFYCRTERTRSGCRYTCDVFGSTPNGNVRELGLRLFYGNRPWESFTYESMLSKAIGKCPKEYYKELDAWLVGLEKQAYDEAERFVNRFKEVHSSLTDENKERLKNVVGYVETKEQADAAMLLATMYAVTQ